MKSKLILIIAALLPSACNRQPASTSNAKEDTPGTLHAAEAPAITVKDGPQFAEMHQTQVGRFTSMSGMGFGRSGPRFFQPGKLELADASGAKWRVDSLQLVSLLENDPPKVYEIPDSTSHMFVGDKPEENTPAPKTRDLTAFETAALETVRKDAARIGVCGTSTDGRTRFVGAITATQTCLRCHSDKHTGDVLGAFTWVLSPLKVQPGKAVSMR